jgi:hypothetical protein
MIAERYEFIGQGPNLRLLRQHLTMQRQKQMAGARTGLRVVN